MFYPGGYNEEQTESIIDRGLAGKGWHRNSRLRAERYKLRAVKLENGEDAAETIAIRFHDDDAGAQELRQQVTPIRQ